MPRRAPRTILHHPTHIIIESEGTRCPPTPMVDLFRASHDANLGDVIELRTTERMAESDVKVWAKRSGNKRGKEAAETSAKKASMYNPDETKITPKAMLQLVTIGDFAMGLRTLEQGTMLGPSDWSPLYSST